MKLLLCSLLALATTARAQDCDPQKTAQDVLKREGQFHRIAEEKGTRAAVLEFFGDEAVVFEPEPVNAKKLWQARPEGGPTSKWQPLVMSMARSCDLAFTAGRMEWKPNQEDEKPAGYGEYVHVWRRQKQGTWKVALEVQAQVPGPRQVDDLPQVVIDTGPSPAPSSSGAAKKLRRAEKWFTETAATDSTSALVGSSSESIRVHREGVFPALGRAPATLMLSVRRGSLNIKRLGGGISRGLDLAYTYGRYSLVRPENTERGHYLQIWRTDAKGEWTLLLDHQTPLPMAEKEGAE